MKTRLFAFLMLISLGLSAQTIKVQKPNAGSGTAIIDYEAFRVGKMLIIPYGATNTRNNGVDSTGYVFYNTADSTLNLYQTGKGWMKFQNSVKVNSLINALLSSPAFSGTPTAPNPLTTDSTTKIATTSFVKKLIATASSGSVVDATTSVKGVVKLAGDLGGTADLPTVPNAVKKTGDETIAGVKTFSATNIVVGSVPFGGGNVSANNTNVAIGVGSGQGTSGSNKIAIGYNTMNTASGSNNIAIGINAGNSVSVGTGNVFVGSYASTSVSSGYNNVSIGLQAARTAANGNGNVFIGAYAGYSSTGNDKFGIGSGENSSTPRYLMTGDFSTADLKFYGTTESVKWKITALNTAPSSASDTGVLGEIRITATYIYVCTATNTWVRSALAAW